MPTPHLPPFRCARLVRAVTRRLVAALILFTLVPEVRAGSGVNIDFGTSKGEPSAAYGAASGQVGVWNQAGLGVTALVSPSGVSTGASATVSANSGTGNVGGSPVNDDERLLNDNFFSSGGAPWSVALSGLADGTYRVFLYAPSHTSVPSGTMSVGGTPVAELPGSATASLVEGTSWAKVTVEVSGGALSISGAGVGFSGLAGLQLVPLEPTGVNIDFGTLKGEPSAAYGAASGQAGAWNQAGLGATALADLFGLASGVSVTVAADTGTGNVGGSPVNDDERLLNDNFYSSGGVPWSVTVSGLPDGTYRVFLYAPSHTSVPSGTMMVGGTPVAELPGSATASLVEGTSWAKVTVEVSGGALSISGAGVGFSGLAGLQLVPLEPTGVNIDFGTSKGEPSAAYGAASGQAGAWNQAGLGATALTDLFGLASGVSVLVAADTGTGNVGGSPVDDDERLLNDNFYSFGGSAWSVTVSGLPDGIYQVFLYAPSHTSVPSGTMMVGGTPVAELPGSATASLSEGTSWARVTVGVSNGALPISGAGVGFSGLAGLQLVPAFGPVSYCSSGTSASGCNALISSTGAASATAATGFSLMASGVEGGKDGLFFFGTNGRQANPWGNGTSRQCVVPPVIRGGLLASTGTNGACDGAFGQDLNALWTAKPPKNPGAGAVVQAQLWYRDPLNTSNQTTSLSDAIEFQVGP
jgi:hypothetical protein